MNFFLYFPFYNTKLATSNQFYEQYLKLRAIVNFLMSHTVNLNQLEEFEGVVERYIELSRSNGLSFTLKLHHLQHYRKLITDFGPLANFSTLKFERYHQVGKKAAARSNSKINLPFQIARAYCKSSVNTSDEPEAGLLICKDNIRFEMADEFLSFIDLSADLLLLDFTTFGKAKIESGSFYLVSETDQTEQKLPVFFYVDCIVKQDGQTQILGYFVSADSFVRDMYSYLVQFSSGPSKLDLSLKFFKKLELLELESGEQFISKTFHILSPINYSI